MTAPEPPARRRSPGTADLAGRPARGGARQAVPRPPWARRVEPPVDGLEAVDPAAQLSIGAVRDAFADSPAPAGLDRAVGAAVLIALMPRDVAPVATFDSSGGDLLRPAVVVLIRRAVHLRANPGEIAFPGGGVEPGEEPLAAALREAYEEVDLRPAGVEVLGRLSTLGRSRASASIAAFVGAIRGRPALDANPAEVDRILVVPLAELVAPGRYWQERWDETDEGGRTMHFFDLGEDVIWGATAQLLHSFLVHVLRRAEAPGPGDPDGAH